MTKLKADRKTPAGRAHINARARQRRNLDEHPQCVVCQERFTRTRASQKKCPQCSAVQATCIRQCRRCDEPFRARRPTTTICSRTCGSARGKGHIDRARHYGVAYEQIDRNVVFERDGWLCGLCHTPIDRRAVWPSLRSASLDHVVPMSCGGPHLYTNVQAAHFGCNVAKGAGRRIVIWHPNAA